MKIQNLILHCLRSLAQSRVDGAADVGMMDGHDLLTTSSKFTTHNIQGKKLKI